LLCFSPLQYEAPTIPQPSAVDTVAPATSVAPATAAKVEVVDNGQQTDVNMPFLHVDSNDNGNVNVNLPGLNVKCVPTDHGTQKCTSTRWFRTTEVRMMRLLMRTRQADSAD
jgi:hypothetical protein